MKTILVFGNEFLKEDSMAKKLADEIKSKELNFVKCNSVDDIFKQKGELVIMDVVKGIKKPMIILDVGKLEAGSITSLHDFDLGFFLKLLNEMGQIKKLKIIGVPEKGNVSELKKQVLKLV